MTQLLIVILDDLSCMPELIQTWNAIGVPGVTILESAGGYRASSWLSKVGLESLDHLFEAKDVQRRTLFAAIDDVDLMNRAIAEAERVVGGFDRPNSGLLLVIPAVLAKGTSKTRKRPSEQYLPPTLRSGWRSLRSTPVEDAEIILDLMPTTVLPDTPLDEVAQAMLTHPNVHVACVVAEDGRLIGILKLRSLADDLFFHILPEEFLGEVTDLDRVMDFADKSRMRVAADAMQKPVCVKRSDTMKDAFKKMHENDLPGLPVVDEYYKVIGYINLLELLGICLKHKRENTGHQD